MPKFSSPPRPTYAGHTGGSDRTHELRYQSLSLPFKLAALPRRHCTCKPMQGNGSDHARTRAQLDGICTGKEAHAHGLAATALLRAKKSPPQQVPRTTCGSRQGRQKLSSIHMAQKRWLALRFRPIMLPGIARSLLPTSARLWQAPVCRYAAQVATCARCGPRIFVPNLSVLMMI